MYRPGRPGAADTTARHMAEGEECVLGDLFETESVRRTAELGLRRVTVDHDAENAPAAEPYGSLGFTRECRTHGYRRAKAQASMSR
ncbi:hypothetical protein [Streptomyces sp. TLI_105]|uniref:hypothetical protein n=1 Tax=Streptomyces sp. TLI_105 TaxID=1881019 RepID=UPI0008955EA8|nr:hypothetical protein [Streptomyces sp. TLI_105]SEE00521.1 hypothetical protein SAMN05428939_7019 [Streptomyces sp. TLI_105]